MNARTLGLLGVLFVLAGCETAPPPAAAPAKQANDPAACPDTLLSHLYKVQCDASPTTGGQRNIIFY